MIDPNSRLAQLRRLAQEHPDQLRHDIERCNRCSGTGVVSDYVEVERLEGVRPSHLTSPNGRGFDRDPEAITVVKKLVRVMCLRCNGTGIMRETIMLREAEEFRFADGGTVTT